MGSIGSAGSVKSTGLAVLLNGVLANLALAAAPQIWNVEPWQTVVVGEFTGENPKMKSLQPIELLGSRNGVCSGYVVVTRNGESLKGLKGTVGALVGVDGKGRIAADRIQVRYADGARPENSHMPAHRFDRLLEKPPAEVPAKAPGVVKAFKKDFAPRSTVPVATVPVWVTVRIPADAGAGEYAGALTIELEGLTATAVPLRLKVVDWVVPAPRDFQIRTIGWLNPEAVAKHYGLARWSEEHFKRMGRSMELMLELGSRHIAIDVTQYYPSRDNEDTMIKWIKQADGTYKYDFTLFDKYCDLAAEKLGKPFPIRLNMWRGPRNGGGGEVDDYPNSKVLMFDPSTNQPVVLDGPHKLGSEEMKAFWKPVMDEMRTRLEKRGWFEAAGPNWMCYCGGMTPALASMVKSIWPDGRWLDVTHARQLKYGTLEKGVSVPVFVSSTVWSEGTFDAYVKWKSGPYPRQYAGKFDPATAICSHVRCQWREADWPALWVLRTKHEEAIIKGNDGVECVGADHFPVKDIKGRWRGGDWSAFAQGPNNGMVAVLGAGDEGPIGSERFEAMREGIQLCEAMVFIQKAIEGKKISGDLAARANTLLDDRTKAMVACLKPTGHRNTVAIDLSDYAKGARERDEALLAMAAEVGKVGK